ncbi:MAG: DUF1983 domain-containing protein [Flavobacteriales bacterium]|nr:DUF1983 domain-containing protein [Flavobacteriales bacterium]
MHSALQALKEATEIGLGRRGDPLDQFVTLRDLRDSGVASVGLGRGGATLLGPPSNNPGAPLIEYVPPDYGTNDYSVPPAPLGVVARGVPPNSMMVTWNPPGYGNHAYAEVYVLLENPSPPHARTLSDLMLDLPAALAGTAAGTIFMHRGLTNVPRTGATAIQMAEAPAVRYYWVRFVSAAGVKGPFAPLAGANAALSIDPVLMLDAMIRGVEVSPIYANLRGWIGVENQTPILQAGGVLGYITQSASNTNGLLQSIWAVNMRHNTQNGLAYAAGFGLGMETDESTGRSVSTFLVNANQFAIMGAAGGHAGAALVACTGSVVGANVELRCWLATSTQQFSVDGSPPPPPPAVQLPSKVVLAGHGNKVRWKDGTLLDNPLCGMAGKEGVVIAVGTDIGGVLTVLVKFIGAAGDFRPNVGWSEFGIPGVGGNPSYRQDYFWKYVLNEGTPTEETRYTFNSALLPSTCIPFIVDTAANPPRVGIRGNLIVDGLIRAEEADFNLLRAGTAFIDLIQAEAVNANVVIAQRLIAGTPGEGALTNDQYNQISNYILELNNPALFSSNPAAGFPLRFWKPADGNVRFSLNGNGDITVGGHMSVAGNGVIGTTGTNLASFGGSGADTGPTGSYALWCGPKASYGTVGQLRTEANGLFWIKDDARAGFNAELFLGANAFDLPFLATSNGPGAAWNHTGASLRATTEVQVAVSPDPIIMRSRRNGSAATYIVFVTGMLASIDGPDGDKKRFDVFVELVGSPSTTDPALAVIQSFPYDDWYPESLPFTYFNAVQLPAGPYYVRIRKVHREGRRVSICQGWTVMAFAVQGNAGVLPAGVPVTPPGQPLPGGATNPPPAPAPPPFAILTP